MYMYIYIYNTHTHAHPLFPCNSFHDLYISFCIQLSTGDLPAKARLVRELIIQLALLVFLLFLVVSAIPALLTGEAKTL